MTSTKECIFKVCWLSWREQSRKIRCNWRRVKFFLLKLSFLIRQLWLLPFKRKENALTANSEKSSSFTANISPKVFEKKLFYKHLFERQYFCKQFFKGNYSTNISSKGDCSKSNCLTNISSKGNLRRPINQQPFVRTLSALFYHNILNAIIHIH